jgi:hypothetical protein
MDATAHAPLSAAFNESPLSGFPAREEFFERFPPDEPDFADA